MLLGILNELLEDSFSVFQLLLETTVGKLEVVKPVLVRLELQVVHKGAYHLQQLNRILHTRHLGVLDLHLDVLKAIRVLGEKVVVTIHDLSQEEFRDCPAFSEAGVTDLHAHSDDSVDKHHLVEYLASDLPPYLVLFLFGFTIGVLPDSGGKHIFFKALG